MNTPKIHVFDPVIYPFRLWVSINPTFESVSEKFYGLITNCERIDIPKGEFYASQHVIARTTLVNDKESGWIGCLVMIYIPKQTDVRTICHESAHVADFVCEQFDIETRGFDNGEAYAYLIGWIADCINKVKTNKY